MIVGSWPGPSFSTNDFVRTFCTGLADAGAEVVDISDPRQLPQRLDVLHIHWPEQLFWRGGSALRIAVRIATTLRAIARMKAAGTRIVWMVHNLRPHDLTGFRRISWVYLEARLAKLVDAFMTLSPATIGVVRANLPQLSRLPATAAIHPRYPATADLVSQAEARIRTGLPIKATIFGFIGFLRPYKGVEELIGAFCEHKSSAARLLIAGASGSDAYSNRLRRLAAADPRIDLRLGRLAQDELKHLTIGVDAIVLPFRDYLHSGSMIHAISHRRPVITPDAPFARDVATAVGPTWVSRYEGLITGAILDDWTPPAGAPDLHALRPEALAAAAMDLYNRLLAPNYVTDGQVGI